MASSLYNVNANLIFTYIYTNCVLAFRCIIICLILSFLYDFCEPKAAWSYFHIFRLKPRHCNSPELNTMIKHRSAPRLISKVLSNKNTLIKSERCGWRQSKGEVTDLINPNTGARIEADANFSISSNPRWNYLKKRLHSVIHTPPPPYSTLFPVPSPVFTPFLHQSLPSSSE